MKKIPLLVVCGPTASGKTALSIHLAKKLNGEIISADSMQIYKGMDIGTAKPDIKEKKGVPHHMLDIINPEDKYSVANYVKQAREVIVDVFSRGKLPILAGGTGLYIQAIVNNIQFPAMPYNKLLREELTKTAKKEGNQAVWETLNECDPELAATLHPNNLGRVIRGIEVFSLTNKPLSQWQIESRQVPSPFTEFMIGLNYDNRAELYSRINQRVDTMINSGLLDEVNWLIQRGCSITAGQAIGYKELLGYIKGEQTLLEASEHLKQETRRYAKRQLTWMRTEQRIHWLYINRYKDFLDLCLAAEILINHWQQIN